MDLDGSGYLKNFEKNWMDLVGFPWASLFQALHRSLCQVTSEQYRGRIFGCFSLAKHLGTKMHEVRSLLEICTKTYENHNILVHFVSLCLFVHSLHQRCHCFFERLVPRYFMSMNFSWYKCGPKLYFARPSTVSAPLVVFELTRFK